MASPLDPLLTPINVPSTTAAAAAACVVTLPGVVNKTTYITGLIISTANPAAAVTGVATVTGLLLGTISIEVVETVAGGFLLVLNFPGPGLAASAQNTAIVVTLPAIVGGAVSAVTAFGYQYG